MAVVIRYIPFVETLVVERFIALKRLKITDAETIFTAISETLTEIGIKWENVLSICFDGASAMAGQFNGVQAKCKEVNQSIFYVNCYAHCLNLALVSACTSHKDNALIADFFGVIQLMYNFNEGSPKRHAVFEDLVSNTNSKLKTLKSLADTRWACRSEAVSAVAAQYENIEKALEDIIDDTSDYKARATGKGILYQMKTWNFITCLYIMNHILQIVVNISKTLQSSNIDLCEAVEDVKNVALALTEMRNYDSVFEEIYQKTKELCSKMNIYVPAPRKRRVPARLQDVDETTENNTDVITKRDELRMFTFYPVIDVLVQGLNDRFSQETNDLICAVGRIIGLNLGPKKWTTKDLEILVIQFKINTDELCAELRILKTIKENEFHTDL